MIDSVSLIFRRYPCGSLIEKARSSIAIAIFASTIANCRPMHARAPLPNGLLACGWCAASASGSQRSMSNSSGSPHTLALRCSPAVKTLTGRSFFSSQRPPTTSSWNGASVKAGAVGHSLSASFSTRSITSSFATCA